MTLAPPSQDDRYGTAFLRASTALDNTSRIELAEISAAFDAALEGVTTRGKATTGEKLGFVGRGEGAAAMAIATLDSRG